MMLCFFVFYPAALSSSSAAFSSESSSTTTLTTVYGMIPDDTPLCILHGTHYTTREARAHASYIIPPHTSHTTHYYDMTRHVEACQRSFHDPTQGHQTLIFWLPTRATHRFLLGKRPGLSVASPQYRILLPRLGPAQASAVDRRRTGMSHGLGRVGEQNRTDTHQHLGKSGNRLGPLLQTKPGPGSSALPTISLVPDRPEGGLHAEASTLRHHLPTLRFLGSMPHVRSLVLPYTPPTYHHTHTHTLEAYSNRRLDFFFYPSHTHTHS